MFGIDVFPGLISYIINKNLINHFRWSIYIV